ncbi:MAG: DUF3187 family protein [Gammaproteobacteria bacterium]|nr:DUF3187 family protein [Gammaproteobacteria bacterium]MDH5799984.1 DUF3187 family protein [Gammaproteobacteria bacterium]
MKLRLATNSRLAIVLPIVLMSLPPHTVLGAENPKLEYRKNSVYALEMRNNNPLFSIYGIPRPGNARLVPAGKQQYSLTTEVSSFYAIEKSASERFEADGETYTYVFSWRYGVTQRLQVGLDIPYIRYTGGTLDGFINEWHEFFDLAEGGRNVVPNDRLLIRYERSGQVLLNHQTASRGIGDISINAAWQTQRSQHEAWAVNFNLNLPSGDSQQFQSNGYTDAAVWIQHHNETLFYELTAGYFYGIGLNYVEDSDTLPQFLNHWAGFGNLGAGVHLTPNVVFISQLDIHTPLYSGPEVNDLSGYGVQLSLGGRINTHRNGQLHLSVGEDLVLDVSPDVTFHLRYEWRL